MTRLQDVYPDDRVSLREVGLRDGLQLVKTFPSTAEKQRGSATNGAGGGISRSACSRLRRARTADAADRARWRRFPARTASLALNTGRFRGAGIRRC